MKRVLLLVKTITSFGGAERMCAFLTNVLRSGGYEVDVVAKFPPTGGSETYAFPIDKDIKIYPLADIIGNQFEFNFFEKVYKKLNSIFGIFNHKCFSRLNAFFHVPVRYRKKLIKFINDNKYDAVVGVESFFSMVLGIISDKISAKTLGWQHCSYEAYFSSKSVGFWHEDYLAHYAFAQLDKYIVLNEIDQKKYKDRFGLDTQYIYNPKSFESERVSNLNNTQFLAVGRLAEEKQIDKIIQAYYIYSQNVKESWELLIVGDGYEKEKCQKLIEEYNLQDKIILHPFIKEVKELYLHASCFLTASKSEGFGLTVLEALTCGCPVIAFDLPAYKPMLENNVNSIIVEMNNVQKFASAMEKISTQDELRVKLGLNAKLKSEEFGCDVIGAQWLDVFDKLLN